MSARTISQTASTPAPGEPPAEPISPELCLVCPELAEWARRQLPEYDLTEPGGPTEPRLRPAGKLRLPTHERQPGRRNQRPLRYTKPVRPRRTWIQPRRAVATALVLLALAASTVMATPGRDAPSQPAAVVAELEPLRPADAAGPAKRVVVVVPNVCRKAYVFAKGLLQDWGFAWRVTGDVQGFAANFIAEQQPVPGTRVIASGAPLIELRLVRNPHYRERGKPENGAPYPGTALQEAAPARSVFDLGFRRAPVLNPCERGEPAAERLAPAARDTTSPQPRG